MMTHLIHSNSFIT